METSLIRKYLPVALWSIPLLLTSGCGNPPVTTTENTTTATTTATNTTAGTAPPASNAATTGAAAGASTITLAELDKVTKAAKPYKLALIVKTRNNPFFDPMIKAAQDEAKKLGAQLEVQAPAQETDKEQQFAKVQDVTARKVDAILIAPADSRGIIPALKQAADKGVLVINLDNRVDTAAAKSAGLELGGYVGADNEAGGNMAGKAMVKALNGKGKVAIIEGIRGADNAEARKRGFEVAKGSLEVVASESAEWDTDKAHTKLQNLLPVNPGLQGVFCANDKMAIGAIKAIADAHKAGKMTVIGYDNIPDVQQYLKDGQMYATIDQHPDLMGKYGVHMAIGVLDKLVPKGREFLVPLELVAKKAG